VGLDVRGRDAMRSAWRRRRRVSASHRQVRRARGEEGDSTLAVVLCVPALLVVIMALTQLVFWYHARHVVTAAAQAGSRAARVVGGTPESGEAKAVDMLAQLGPRLVLEPVVTATAPEPSGVTVEVRGRAPQLLPGFSMWVSASSSGPREEFRGDQ